MYVSAKIVNAVCVLHNIAVHWRLPEEELHYDEIDRDQDRQVEPYMLMEEGAEVRERLIRTHFTN